MKGKELFARNLESPDDAPSMKAASFESA